MDSPSAQTHTPRRAHSRLRLGIAARLQTLAGVQAVRLIDLSQSGAQLILSEPADIRQAVLTWLNFEAFGSIVWREDDHIGMHFDEVLPFEHLIETRQRAPSVVREEAMEAKLAAKRWVAGTLRQGFDS